jgi:hypothetical protein
MGGSGSGLGAQGAAAVRLGLPRHLYRQHLRLSFLHREARRSAADLLEELWIVDLPRIDGLEHATSR